MLIDREHRPWFWFSAVSVAAGTAAYIGSSWSSPYGHTGGSLAGLVFGIVAAAMMVFAGLLAVRKWLRIRRLGNARFWLRGHLWLGTVSIVFVFFHAGFEWGGLLEQLLWLTLAVVAVTGFLGLAFQQFLPRLLWLRTPLETIGLQVPYQCDRMTVLSDMRVANECGTSLGQATNGWQEVFQKLSKNYEAVSAGSEGRSEKNALKLQLFQQIPSPEARDFCWDLAGHAKAELQLLRFEGDFPELLQKTYADLADSSGPAADGPSGNQAKPTTGAAAASPLDLVKNQKKKPADETGTKPKKSGSPLDAIRQAGGSGAQAKPSAVAGSPLDQIKAAGRAKGGSGSAAGKSPAPSSPLDQIRGKAQSSADDTKPEPQKTVSPLDAVRQSAGASPDPKPLKPVGSPLDQIKAAGAAKQGGASFDKKPAAPPSPLDQIRSKAEESAATPGQDAQPAKPVSPLDAIRQAGGRKPAPEKAAVSGSPLDQIRGKAKESAEPPAESAKPGQPAASPLDAIRKASRQSPSPKTSAAAGSPLDQIKSASKAKKPAAGGQSAAARPSAAQQIRGAGKDSAAAAPAAANNRQTTSAPRPAPPRKATNEEKNLLHEFYVEQVRPYISETRSSPQIRRSPFATHEKASQLFQQQKMRLPPVLHPLLASLAEACERRRQFEVQRQYHRWLHWWLMIHVPVSVGLLVLLAAHIVVALRVIPFQF